MQLVQLIHHHKQVWWRCMCLYSAPCAAQIMIDQFHCVYACVSVLFNRSPFLPLAFSFAHTLRGHRCLCVSVNRCALVVVLIAFLSCTQIELISIVFCVPERKNAATVARAVGRLCMEMSMHRRWKRIVNFICNCSCIRAHFMDYREPVTALTANGSSGKKSSPDFLYI